MQKKLLGIGWLLSKVFRMSLIDKLEKFAVIIIKVKKSLIKLMKRAELSFIEFKIFISSRNKISLCKDKTPRRHLYNMWKLNQESSNQSKQVEKKKIRSLSISNNKNSCRILIRKMFFLKIWVKVIIAQIKNCKGSNLAWLLWKRVICQMVKSKKKTKFQPKIRIKLLFHSW